MLMSMRLRIDNILNRYIKYIYIYCKTDFEIYLYIVTNIHIKLFLAKHVSINNIIIIRYYKTTLYTLIH